MDGGNRVAEFLKAQGITHLFTLVGGHISPILVHAKQLGIRVVDTRHEVNAVFAADAMARLTGMPGVAAVTAGPGVTNSVTAIKNAQLAQSPVVLLAGATATLLRGRGALQDIDQMSLLEPHVKYAARPRTMREVVPALEEAFYAATSGVPGPVCVELALDLLYPERIIREQFEKKTSASSKSLFERALSMYVKGNLAYVFTELGAPKIEKVHTQEIASAKAGDVKSAVRMLEKAARPLMIVGSQAMVHAPRAPELAAAIERMGVPVYLSGMARGLLPPGHRLLRRHKRREALKRADVVVLAGVPCDFRLDYGVHVARAKTIGVNLSEADLNKNRRPTLGVLADPFAFLTAMSSSLSKRCDAWLEELRVKEDEREKEIAAIEAESTEYVNPIALCRSIDRHLGADSILVGDGGDFVATASYVTQPRRPLSWLDPGAFGTLGVGAGFALAAKLERPASDVWLLYGDGAAGFSIMELDTFARHKVPVIAVIGNDAGWTQIERDQRPLLGDDVACRLTYMDYHIVAEGCGAKGIRVDDPARLDAALDDALALSRAGHPVLVNVRMGKTEFRKGSISV
jgi:thiamine pyrophosphate-dependent acetolactate synthase large subunit-like protein